MKTAQLGIELGTRHLRICTRDKEEFLKIKNMIAFDEDAKLKAFGNEAFAMLRMLRNEHLKILHGNQLQGLRM